MGERVAREGGAVVGGVVELGVVVGGGVREGGEAGL